MESDYREVGVDIEKNRIPGMVYLTALDIDKPDNDTNQRKSIDIGNMLGYW